MTTQVKNAAQSAHRERFARRQTAKSRRLQMAIFVLFIAVTFQLARYCLHQAWRYHALQAARTTTNATVTDLYTMYGRYREVYFVAYAYDVDGHVYARDEDIPETLWSTFQKGGKIPIVYLPAEPDAARCIGYTPRDGFTWTAWFYCVLVVIGIGALTASLISAWKARRNAGKTQESPRTV